VVAVIGGGTTQSRGGCPRVANIAIVRHTVLNLLSKARAATGFKTAAGRQGGMPTIRKPSSDTPHDHSSDSSGARLYLD